MLYERADLGQGANNNDVAVPRARPGLNFDLIDKRTDDFQSLRACGLVTQDLFEFNDFPGVAYGGGSIPA